MPPSFRPKSNQVSKPLNIYSFCLRSLFPALVLITLIWIWVLYTTSGVQDTNPNSPPPPPPEKTPPSKARIEYEKSLQDISFQSETQHQRPTFKRTEKDEIKPGVLSLQVWWHAPIFSGGGYSSEAMTFILGLNELFSELNLMDLLRVTQHGDSHSTQFLSGLPHSWSSTLQMLSLVPTPSNSFISICHSEPGAWDFPMMYLTSPCPPEGSVYRIGRTMFETDRTPSGWATRMNQMDEIWVPSKHNMETFEKAGVLPEKLVYMPEPVDCQFFRPINPNEEEEFINLASTRIPGLSQNEAGLLKFFSVFKIEERKGWDILLEAYFSEFSRDDPVILYLLASTYHSKTSLSKKIEEFIESSPSKGNFRSPLPRVKLIESHVPTRDLPILYQWIDVLVMSTRGEGWGRPHVEAMCTAKPVIATFWSGTEEYMTNENSYPLEIESELVPVNSEAFPGHRWAQPKISHLRQLMRTVFTNPTEAKQRGLTARQDMLKNYSTSKVSQIVYDRLLDIQNMITKP